MSVIQQIQEKYAKLMAIIIAVALIIFVVMLAFESGGSLFRLGNSNDVGKVNGKEIGFASFQRRIDQEEASIKAEYAQYGGAGEAARLMAQDQAWDREIARLLISSETDKLGLQVGKKEIGDILYGDNPPNDLKQGFTDPKTGIYNAAEAKRQLDRILKSGKPDEKIRVSDYINQQEQARLSEKYSSLLFSTINYPKWMIEKENADNSQMARISYVKEVYSSIPDSAITISNKEIEEYINKHKEDYKQEESRSIAYLTFSALPTAADSTTAREKLLKMKPGLDSTKDAQQFLESLGVQTYYNSYINGSRIQVPSKDSIFRIPLNTIYGPYLDGGSYSLAKLLGIRSQPDTVKVRHILVGTIKRDQETGQSYPVRDSATAYKLADSIMTAIGKGSNFDSLVVKLSDDDGSKANGGVYDNVVSGQMVAEFNDFIFGKPAGTRGIVNTAFGAHYIEILSQKGSSPAYKIAYLSQPIEVSQETDANALNEATKFAGNSRDLKSFDASADKQKAQGRNKLIATGITPTAYQIQGLGISRPFVRSIYEAKKGEVLQPEKVGDNYVVAIVTEVNKEGTQSVAAARMRVEPLLIKHKKAEQIRKKLGTPATLEAAAAALGGKPIEPADSIRLNGTQLLIASEPKVIGASFNPANRGKVSPPLEGVNGVYVIRVENVTATPVIDANVAEQRKQRIQQFQMQLQQLYMQRRDPQMLILIPLREAATIKDNRGKLF